MLRKGKGSKQAVSVLNWGSTADGHTHRDTLSILFWADGIQMLNSTGYASDPKEWYREAAAAHNCALIDGMNYKRTLVQNALFFSESKRVSAVRASALCYDDPRKTLMRTVLLIQPRSSAIPFLVDFVNMAGGKNYDLMFRVQSDIGEKTETATVLSPEMKKVRKAKNMKEFLPYSGREYRYITDPSQGIVSGNAEVRWDFPVGRRFKHLRAIFPGEKDELLLTGNASGVRTGKDGPGRLTRRIIRHVGKKDRSPLVFASVFESYRKTPDIVSVKKVPVTGNPAASALLVRSSDSSDLIVSSTENSPVTLSAEGKTITFDGLLAVFSFLPGKEPEIFTVGGNSLSCDGKKIRIPQPVRGNLKSFVLNSTPNISEEANAVVDLDRKIASSLIGHYMFIRHGSGTVWPWKIIEIKQAGDVSRVTLHRPARRSILSVKKEKGSRFVLLNAGRLTVGDVCEWNGQSRRIKEIIPPAPKTRDLGGMILEKPFEHAGDSVLRLFCTL